MSFFKQSHSYLSGFAAGGLEILETSVLLIHFTRGALQIQATVHALMVETEGS